jgi:hypothetical protein
MLTIWAQSLTVNFGGYVFCAMNQRECRRLGKHHSWAKSYNFSGVSVFTGEGRIVSASGEACQYPNLSCFAIIYVV